LEQGSLLQADTVLSLKRYWISLCLRLPWPGSLRCRAPGLGIRLHANRIKANGAR